MLIKIQFILWSVITFVGPVVEARVDYLSGRELCADKLANAKPSVSKTNSSKLKEENPYWVTVPKFYNKAHSFQYSTTEIYAYTLKPLNYNLPTLLFFMGGPGSSSRNIQFSLPHTNILYFEQRGVSCSRPLLEEDFYNPKFYSSEYTARDALEIVKFLHLPSVTIYGHSFGTIPATIFASLFPEYTRNLILESVVSTADELLIQSRLKKYYLQNLFNSFDVEKQNKIINIGKTFAPANWFSKAGTMMLYLNDGVLTYKRFLDNLLVTPDENIKSAIEYFYFTSAEEDLFYSSQVVLGMLSCQETLVAKNNLSPDLVFDDKNNLQYDNEKSFFNLYCEQLKIPSSPNHIYRSQKYPVKVPIYYFLGESDGATDLEQGLEHFNQVPQGERYLFVLKNGGHLPNLNFIKEYRSCEPSSSGDHCQTQNLNQHQVSIFNSIVQFNKIDSDLIESFNQLSPNPWFTDLPSFRLTKK